MFNLIDTDGSNTIDKNETLEFWSNNYAKVNSRELFSQVDKNNDGEIQIHEWIEFWTIVYRSGYSEKDIITEVYFLLNC